MPPIASKLLHPDGRSRWAKSRHWGLPSLPETEIALIWEQHEQQRYSGPRKQRGGGTMRAITKPSQFIYLVALASAVVAPSGLAATPDEPAGATLARDEPHHHLLLQNEFVRIMRVVVPPGGRHPLARAQFRLRGSDSKWIQGAG
jgi:hypothetical protein